jgi:hypothetical protein
MRDDDAFRFANVLHAWLEFDGNRVAASGQGGGVRMGSTTAQLGPLDATFAWVAMPDLVASPEIGDGWVRFTQTTRWTHRIPAAAAAPSWQPRSNTKGAPLTGRG